MVYEPDRELIRAKLNIRSSVILVALDEVYTAFKEFIDRDRVGIDVTFEYYIKAVYPSSEYKIM